MIGDIDVLATATFVGLFLVALSLFLAALRLFRGPSLADRVVALELIASLMVGGTALLAVLAEQGVLIDVAIAVTLVGFMGAVGFARYMEKGGVEEEPRR